MCRILLKYYADNNENRETRPADVNVVDNAGESTLFYAIKYDLHKLMCPKTPNEFFDMLRRKNVNFGLRNKNGKCILHQINENDIDIVAKFLTIYNFSETFDYNSPLILAARIFNGEIL